MKFIVYFTALLLLLDPLIAWIAVTFITDSWYFWPRTRLSSFLVGVLAGIFSGQRFDASDSKRTLKTLLQGVALFAITFIVCSSLNGFIAQMIGFTWDEKLYSLIQRVLVNAVVQTVIFGAVFGTAGRLSKKNK